MSSLQSLLADLISFQSLTPYDAGCQDYMINFLKALGFDCQLFNNAPVSNFFARWGTQKPLLVFAGHTDVVPVGDLNQWQSDPFLLTAKEERLYGRGTADMKGGLAAMLDAVSRFINTYPQLTGSLGFLITSGEEGDLFDLGTPYVMQRLAQQGIQLDYCVVGEPSSSQHIGDVLKIGRRGSLSAKLILQGKQGHVAYPHLADNPIHNISSALMELAHTQWDEGNLYFPPTTLQITEINASGQASNIIPGEVNLSFNFRFSTEQSEHSLKQAVEAIFKQHDLHPIIHWRLNGQPFLTAQGKLLESCINAIEKITGITPELSTSGGTSDGRFIAPYQVEVVELGLVNASIHQINENIATADLAILSDIYFGICENILLV